MKTTIALAICLFSASALAAPYSIYSKPRQCYGYFADSKESFSVRLVTDIIDKGLSKGDLIGTAIQFKTLKTKKKLKTALMCKSKYGN